MSKHPKHQSSNENGIKPKRQQDFKARLLSDRFPDLSIGPKTVDKLHMIDVNHPLITKIQTRDGGWIEVQGRRVKTYGNPGFADQLAAEIGTAVGADEIERLTLTSSTQKKNSGMRQRRKPGEVLDLNENEVESLADRWRSRGYTHVRESNDGVWVDIGACRLQDLGDEIRVFGKASDEGIRAMIGKAVADWGSEIEIYGSTEFKDMAWIEGQRQGVKVYGQDGNLYEPSPKVRAQYEADRSKLQTQSEELKGVRRHGSIAALLKSSAAGDKKALADLETTDASLHDFVTLYLDDEGRTELVKTSPEDTVQWLEDFRQKGREAARPELEDFDPDATTDKDKDKDITAAIALTDFDDLDYNGSYDPADDPETPEYAARMEYEQFLMAEADEQQRELETP